MSEHLLFTANVDALEKELTNMKGRLCQRFTDSVILADLPAGIAEIKLEHAGAVAPDSLDDQSKVMVDAWQAAPHAPESDPFREWDAEGVDWPRNPSTDPLLEKQERDGGEALTDDVTTCRTMTGRIGVGVVIVVANAGPLKIDETEQRRIFAQVQYGLQQLCYGDPRANLSFFWDARYIETSAASHAPCPDDYETCERPWRNSALETLGYGAVYPESHNKYVQYLKTRFSAKWAYVMYITTFPLTHFAYRRGTHVVLSRNNDSRGRDKLHYVVAHETCHIFGAMDEYAKAKCVCGSTNNCQKVPNNNCKNCAGTQEECLMAGDNSYRLCKWTRRQLGWSWTP